MVRLRNYAWALSLMVAAASTAEAQTRTTLVPLGSGSQGLLYQPAAPKNGVGLVQMHSFSSTLGHVSCGALASRGYRILCGDTRFTNNANGYGNYEDHVPAIRAAVDYMQKQPGVTTVVLIGHSMGAPMMAFYQHVAEKGPRACAVPERLAPCEPGGLENLPRADGLILLDPHLGDAAATLTYIDPAITDEAAPARRDRSLDMFEAANGFTPKGATYSPEFRKRYLSAQAARNARLIADAQKRSRELSGGNAGAYPDDASFVVPGANAARLFQPDVALLRRTKRPHLLLKADGTNAEQILVSVRGPSGRAADALTLAGSALPTTVKSFLAGRAIRTTPDYDMMEDDITGIDWDSSNTSTPTNVKGVSVPLLIMAMTGHYFLRPSEIILDQAASTDKQLVGLEGATHGLTPCNACAPSPGAFGDTVKRAYDYIDGWLSSRS